MGSTPSSFTESNWLGWFNNASSSSSSSSSSSFVLSHQQQQAESSTVTSIPITAVDTTATTTLASTQSDQTITTIDGSSQPETQANPPGYEIHDTNGRTSWRWSTWSVSTPKKKRKSVTTQPSSSSSSKPYNSFPSVWFDRHKRRTFPPCAQRVLKQEQRRMMYYRRSKRCRLVHRNKQHAFFFPPSPQHHPYQGFKRRHSLSGILTSFIHSATSSTKSKTPPPATKSSASNSHSSYTADANVVMDAPLASDHSNGSSSRTAGRRLALFFSTSSRKSSRLSATVRSSMVLQFAEEDNELAAKRIPETVYQDTSSVVSNHSTMSSCTTAAKGKSNGSHNTVTFRRRQKQRQHNNQERSHWFSNWVLHHPRRKNRHRGNHRYQHHYFEHDARWQQQQGRQKHRQQGQISHPLVPYGPSSSSQHQRRKIHPSSSSGTPTSTDGTHYSPVTWDFIDTDSGSSHHRKYEHQKKALPLIRHATLSDLSSLSSSNPSYALQSSNFLPATDVTSTCGRRNYYYCHSDRYQYYDSYQPKQQRRHQQPSSKRQQSSPRPPYAYRFSAFWKSQSGKSGKQVIHVDELGRAGHVTPWTPWQTCQHETCAQILAILFIAGFLICPTWWVGAILYLKRAPSFDNDVQCVFLWTPRTFGQLNCWMSLVSLILLGVIVAFVIWYHLLLT